MSRRELIEYGFTQDTEVIRASRNFKSNMEWAIEKGLMPKKRFCKSETGQEIRGHGKVYPMSLVKYCHTSSDCFYYRCSKCKMRVGIRTGTLYSFCKLTLMEITRVLFHYFIKNYNAT